MSWSRLRADDASFDHAMTGRCVRNESRRNGHFENDVLVFWRAFHGNQCSAGAYINCSTEFKYRTALGIGPVYKNGKSNRQPRPASRPVFGFTHGNIVLGTTVDSYITLVARQSRAGSLDFGYIMRARLLFVPIILTALICTAADTPNFSGFWKMDSAHSDFGPQTAPESAEYVVRHVGATIAFNYTQDGKTVRVDLIPDNEERVTSETAETAVWTKCYWSGSVLVIESREKQRFGTQASSGVSWTSRWSLSPDGKELTVEKKIHTGDGEFTQKVLFVKQPLPARKSE